MTEAGKSKAALGHLKVLDLSRVMAGPWATQILADLGATVIKVERPGTGDETRGWGPPFMETPDATRRDSGYFLSANRGKQSLTVDLSRPEGQEIVRRLADEADILVENFKIGTLERYGLDHATLRGRNPQLIYCSITGFGQHGPRAHEPAYDFLIQAMGGLMSITGQADGQPGGGPQKVGVPIVDLTTGLYAVIGILAAVAQREITGRGDHIDLAMLDVQASLLANQAMNHLLTGNVPGRHGNGHPNIVPQQVFKCRDGEIVLAVGTNEQFGRLRKMLGDGELDADDLSDNAGRVSRRDWLHERLQMHFGSLDRDDLLNRLSRSGIPAGPINSIAQVVAEPQLREREMIGTLDHPQAGPVPQIFSPLKFAESRFRTSVAPPVLGHDTQSLLERLGYDHETIESFRRLSIV